MSTTDEYYKLMTIDLSQSINSKTKIYLDTKYWVEICDVLLGKRENVEIEKIYLYLKEGVESNRLICPISYRIFKEVLKQDDDESLKQTVALIDELSQGAILREESDRISLELFNFFYDKLNIEMDEDARENYWDYILNIMGYMKPQNKNLSPDDQLMIQLELLKQIKKLRLSDMIKTKWKNSLFRFRDMKIDTDMYDLNKHLHRHEHSTFDEMYLSELGGVIEAYKEIIEDTFKRVGDSQARLKNIEVPTNYLMDIQPIMNMIYYAFKNGEIEPYLPSFDITAMLHAKLRWNTTQKYKQGDFDDFGHAMSALPYYDYFFTERSLHNMIKERKYDKKYNCKVVSKPSDILSLLDI